MAAGAGYAGTSLGLEGTGERYGASYAQFNRGKRSLAVDAADPRGCEAIKRLVKGADVFLQNMRPGVAAKLGLSYDDLRAVNPNLIYCSISGERRRLFDLSSKRKTLPRMPIPG